LSANKGEERHNGSWGIPNNTLSVPLPEPSQKSHQPIEVPSPDPQRSTEVQGRWGNSSNSIEKQLLPSSYQGCPRTASAPWGRDTHSLLALDMFLVLDGVSRLVA